MEACFEKPVIETVINIIHFYYTHGCIAHVPSQSLLMTCYGYVREVALNKLAPMCSKSRDHLSKCDHLTQLTA